MSQHQKAIAMFAAIAFSASPALADPCKAPLPERGARTEFTPCKR